MPSGRRKPVGLTLIELLMVIALMGILAGLVLPRSTPSTYDQLRGAGQILRTDLAFGQSLALTNNSTYRVDFDTDENLYTITHSGPRAALDTLPASPFRNPGDPADQHIVDLDELPRIGAGVRLLAVYATGSSPERVSHVEFGPLGGTTRTNATMIWLAGGAGADTRYLALTVNPLTGLVEVEFRGTEAPPAGMLAQ